MFGYVTANKPEMKIRDYEIYRSFYCGLCRELRDRYGVQGQLSLTFDMTFVLLLLSSLYEPQTQKGMTNCIVHPIVKQPVRRNEITAYAADMNVLLAYYKCLDDWQDDRNVVKRGYSLILQSKIPELERRYPRQSRDIRKGLKNLAAMEQRQERDLDLVAGCSGEILASIMTYKEDVWQKTVHDLGFYLGKFIYILDAYDDVIKDAEKSAYNPFLENYRQDGFDQKVQEVLVMMASQTCRQYEKLPLLRYQDILGNILYSGIWTKYFAILKNRKTEKETTHV